MKFRKQLLKYVRYILICLLVFLFNLISCKKETKLPTELNQSKISTLDNYAWLNNKQKVNSQEVTTWLKQNLPDDYLIDLHLNKAQENVINNHHVIRIPIGNDAALFFTKANDSLKVYAYKWLDQKPGAKLFSGNLFTYSFQDQFVTAQVYSNGKLLRQGSTHLTKSSTSYSSPILNTNKKSTAAELKNTIKAASIGNGLFSIWCWLTGGTWTGFYTNTCAWGQDSAITRALNFIASIFHARDGDSGDSNDDIIGTYHGDGLDNNDNYNSYGGYSFDNNGAGTAWISVWIPPSSNSCIPGPGGELSDFAENCEGHWQTVQITIPTQACSQIMCRDTSITYNSRLNRIFDLLDGQNPVFDSLSVSYKNSYNYDLKFSQSDPNSSNANAYTLFVNTSIGSTTSGEAFVNLNRLYVSSNINSTYINIVRTILHETWHAELSQRLLSTYNTTDLEKIKQLYGKYVTELTASELIDLLDVDQSGYKYISTIVIKSQNGLDKTQEHNYMVKNISIMAKGINQFLNKINSPLANNNEFAYAVALSQLMSVSTYFQDINNIGAFANYFPGYNPTPNYTLTNYISDVYTNNINNVGPLP